MLPLILALRGGLGPVLRDGPSRREHKAAQCVESSDGPGHTHIWGQIPACHSDCPSLPFSESQFPLLDASFSELNESM